jgi:hypothetical protein
LAFVHHRIGRARVVAGLGDRAQQLGCSVGHRRRAG